MTDYIESLPVPPGTTGRFDCPKCGGSKTLSVSNVGHGLVWNCFRAHCNWGGAKIDLSVDTFSTLLTRASERPPEPPTIERPPWWVDVRKNADAVKWLMANGCTDAYQEERADILYDVKLNRVVFLVHDDWARGTGELVDATGRTLDGTYPKWHRYGNSSYPFKVKGAKNDEVAVVVEDCASACAVSHVATGFALMGTTLHARQKRHLNYFFDTVYIALDKDASVKALEISAEVDGVARIVLLEKDLKLMAPDEIKETLQL
tara:strand:+ start:804 stop:1586 length:783 start_codon:yes stop_codon:yes gene_type:complete